MNDLTKQLLTSYHDVSLAFQEDDEMPDDETQELYEKLCSSSRELLSRCIMFDDPRSILFLLTELVTVLEVLKHPVAANHVSSASSILAKYFLEHKGL